MVVVVKGGGEEELCGVVLCSAVWCRVPFCALVRSAGCAVGVLCCALACSGVVKCTAVCSNVLQYDDMHSSVLQCAPVYSAPKTKMSQQRLEHNK